MPQSDERKRAYMRAYMARRRAAEKGYAPFRKVSPNSYLGNRVVSPYLIRRTDVSPFTGEAFQYWGWLLPVSGVPYGLPKHHVQEHMLYLNQQGLTLALTSRGQEFVDLVTGEVGPCSAGIYEQQPTHKVLHEQQDTRILHLEADLVRLEAELAHREVQEPRPWADLRREMERILGWPPGAFDPGERMR